MKLKYGFIGIDDDGNMIDFVQHHCIDVDQITFYTTNHSKKILYLECVIRGTFFKHKRKIQIGKNLIYLEIDGGVFCSDLSEEEIKKLIKENKNEQKNCK